jgi:hypothetical protein
MRKDDSSIHHDTRLFAAGFIIGLIVFSIVTTAARHGLAISCCPASVLETGNLANQTGIVHRISLDVFGLSITVQGRLPFIFKFKCDIRDNRESTVINHESFRVNTNSDRSAEQRLAASLNDISDHSRSSSKTSYPEEKQNVKSYEAQPSLSSQWQWAYGAGVQNLDFRDFGSYSVKYFKDIYSEAKDRNLKKRMHDGIWHYKYGSGRMDESSKLENKNKICTDRH